MRTFAVLCLMPVLFSPVAGAQEAEPDDKPQPFPGFDIYLAERVETDGPVEFKLAGAAIDRPGYDNQPYFLPHENGILYTSQRDGRQTDIYYWEGDADREEQLTATESSEFSPTLMPDGSHFSSVLIEEDGSTQRLWQYDLVSSGNRKVLFLDIEPVGYHAWLDDNRVALFIVGEPLTLHIADLGAGTSVQIAENIGRSLHKVPGKKTLSFVDKSVDNQWVISEYNLDSGSFANLFETLSGSEDFVWLDTQTILMAQEKKLFSRAVREAAWQLAGDYSDSLPGNITRLALNGDGTLLALVVAEE